MKIRNCPDCSTHPGNQHLENCDVEQCSVCGNQRLQCGCPAHDPGFARWSGWWPGSLEAQELGLDLNQFAIQGYSKKIFIKPTGKPWQISDWQGEVAIPRIKRATEQLKLF